MLHFLWILVAIVFVSFVIRDASSDNSDRNVKAVTNDHKRNPDGSYFYEYFLDNGARQKVIGTLKDVNGEKVYSVEGSYSYRQEDGTTVTVKYIADENGFRVLPDRKIAPPNPVELSTRPPVVPASRPPYHVLTQPVISPKAIQSLLGG